MAEAKFRDKRTQAIIDAITDNDKKLSAKHVTYLSVFRERDTEEEEGANFSQFSATDSDGAILYAIAYFMKNIRQYFDRESLIMIGNTFIGVGSDYLGHDVSTRVVSDLKAGKASLIKIFDTSVYNPYFNQEEFFDVLDTQEELYDELYQRQDAQACISLIVGQNGKIDINVVGNCSDVVNALLGATVTVLKNLEIDEDTVVSFLEQLCCALLGEANNDAEGSNKLMA